MEHERHTATHDAAPAIDWGLPVEREIRLATVGSSRATALTVASARLPATGRLDRPAPHVDAAFLVRVQMLRADTTSQSERGCVDIDDLRRPRPVRVRGPFETVLLHVPCRAIDAYVEREGLPGVSAIGCASDTIDPVLVALVDAVMAREDEPPSDAGRASEVGLALLAHVTRTYGRRADRAGPADARAGGLAPWQERRAKALLKTAPGDVSIEDVARACRLSRGHFSKAFRQSTGVAPHAWRVRQRVDVARRLLRESHVPVAEIAVACGFSDQSHLTRVFASHAGFPPATWRRLHADNDGVASR